MGAYFPCIYFRLSIICPPLIEGMRFRRFNRLCSLKRHHCNIIRIEVCRKAFIVDNRIRSVTGQALQSRIMMVWCIILCTHSLIVIPWMVSIPSKCDYRLLLARELVLDYRFWAFLISFTPYLQNSLRSDFTLQNKGAMASSTDSIPHFNMTPILTYLP